MEGFCGKLVKPQTLDPRPPAPCAQRWGSVASGQAASLNSRPRTSSFLFIIFHPGRRDAVAPGGVDAQEAARGAERLEPWILES